MSFKMRPFSAVGSLAAAVLFLSPLYSSATEQDHMNPFTAVKLDTVLPKPLSDLTATRVDDVVYIVGGCDAEDGNRFEAEIGEFLCGSISDKLYRFDPSTEQFTELSSMPTPRYRHASVATGGAIMVLGGRDLVDNIVTDVDVSTRIDIQTVIDFPRTPVVAVMHQ
jgi:N-acetylneuraminic acid mutarotase